MGAVPGGFLCAFFQARVHWEGHLRYFVNRRGDRGRFAESVARTESLQLVGVDGVHHVVEQFAQSWIAVGVVAALQHPVHRVVKILARGFQVPGLEILLAGSEFFLHLLDQVVLSAGDLR